MHRDVFFFTSDEIYILEITDMNMKSWHEDSTKSHDVTYYKKISKAHSMIFNET